MLHLSETRRFLQSSSFWEARPALIGQLYSALWLAEIPQAQDGNVTPLTVLWCRIQSCQIGRVPSQLGGFEFDYAGKYWFGRVYSL